MRIRSLFAAGVSLPVSLAAAAELSAERTAFFESKIRPVLASVCYDCHGPEKQKSGLRLDYRDGWLKGGEHGPAIVPGDAEKSLLFLAISGRHPELKMPKNADPLPAAAVEAFRQWIQDGAADPRDKPAADAGGDWAAAFALRRQWWCWQPLKKVEPPAADGAASPVDRFLRAAMQARGVPPGGEADAPAILRRLSIILTGLPPSPADVDRFTAAVAGGADAMERAVAAEADRLLASPQFGERWARHWMDWLRYAESHGSEGDPAIPHAYQYRDYLIRSLNAGVPYPQLVREHIAGDLLPPRLSADGAVNEAALGPAHLRMVFHGFTPTDALDEFVTFTDNQVDVVSKAFLGLTVSCARCHNHKFDAISQEDYYAMFGVFANNHPATVDVSAPDRDQAVRERMKALLSEIRDAIKKDWRAAGEATRQRFMAWQPASEEQRREAVADGHGPMAAWLAVRDATPEQFAGKWAPVAQAAAEWLKKWRAWTDSKSCRLTGEDWWLNAENEKWSRSGAGLHSERAGARLTLFSEGDRVIAAVSPVGIDSSAMTAKDRGVLASPPFQSAGGRLWAQVSGSNSGIRYVAQNYPRSGLIFPKSDINSPQLRWMPFDMNYWKGDMIHLELWTSPDAPVETGGGDRHWFTLSGVVYPKDDSLEPPPPGVPVQFLHYVSGNRKEPRNRDEVLQLYQYLFEGGGLGGCPAEVADFNNFFLRAGILPNTLTELPTAAPLVAEYRKLEASLKPPVRAPGVMEGGPGDWPLYIRGDHKKPGAPVPRHFLSALDGTPYQTKGSGRRELAESITGPGGALASRVMVNRLWHHVFGRGIVATPDNFGKLGDLPTHPELLDWLAGEFQRSGGSIKSMLRLLVTSRAFRAPAAPSPEAVAKDPENHLLSHWTLRRMEAEAIRDAMLAVSGQLDAAAGGPGVDGGTPRRSVYVRVIRNALDPLLTAFDAPVPSSTRGKRDATNVPAQALALMNAPLVQSWAKAWAAKIAAGGGSRDAQIRAMYRGAFQRDPSPEEVASCLSYLEETASAATRARAEQDALRSDLEARRREQESLTAPVAERLKSAQPPAPPSAAPLAEWTFDDADPKRAGTLPLQFHGRARIEGGALRLDGQGSFVSTAPLGKTLRAKTLEAWVSLGTFDQAGGGVLTVQDLEGNVFDSVVFAEKEPRQWLAGSNFHVRTSSANGPAESDAVQHPVHVAITWSEDGMIRLYRDGRPYGQPYKSDGPVTFQSGACQVLMGCRHGEPGGNRLLTGAIHRARLYDRALTAEELANTAALEAGIVPLETILKALTQEQRDRYAVLVREVVELEGKRNALQPESTPADPLQSLALAMLNMKEFIYLR